MPHTIIEHSFKISEPKINSLLLKFNQNIAKNDGGFDITQCKARTVFCQNFVVADGSSQQDFMHITIKIMQGRSLEIRKKLAENLLIVAKDFLGDFLKENNFFKNPIALSLDVAELEKEIYQKILI